MVGSRALALALADARVAHVVAPTRRALTPHAKLCNPVIDYDRPHSDAEWWAVDGAICALGTTRAAAGPDDAFRRVDRDLPLAIAEQVRGHGGTCFALTSSMGADPRSRFLYTRTKGELEEALGRLGFRSLTIVRPGLLGGNRERPRPGERIIGALLRIGAPILPPQFRISPAEEVARILVEAVIEGAPGTHYVGAAQLARAGES